MAAAFLLVFREVLEAVLVVGVILGYFARTGRRALARWVWAGVAVGVAASIAGAVLFEIVAGGFEGRAEQLFEAVTMLAGAALLSTAIVWLGRTAKRTGVEQAVESKVAGTARWGIVLLVALSVVREGIELTIFLAAARFGAGAGDLPGALLGFAAAIALGIVVFTAAVRVNLRAFFAATNALLVLFAAGLVARGLHELSEAGTLPAIVDPLWNVRAAALGENGALGGVLKGLFGWNSAPTAIEVIGWGSYLAAVVAVVVAVAATRRRR